MPADSLLDRKPRLALAVFVAVVCGAFPLLLALGNHRWFFSDDWDFIAARTGGDLGDLFRPHNEHWSTLPILLYRAIWHGFGIRSYLPYQIPVLLAHLAVGVLLWVLMRRASVAPWMATAAASLFVLFGSGSENIVWAFQIGFVASMAFGLLHLVLADHDGRWDRRDWAGLGAGLAGLMCSGVAVTMVAVVGLAVLVRRGWRAALGHVVPLAALYAIWYFAIGRSSYFGEFGAPSSARRVVKFVGLGLRASVQLMGQVRFVGGVLVVVAGVGLVVLARTRPWREVRAQLAAPGALLVGGVVFLITSGALRAGLSTDRAFLHNRYQHLVVACMIPCVAVGADTVARRLPRIAPVIAALFVIGIPGNVRTLHRSSDADRPYHRGYRDAFLTRAYDPAIRHVPRAVHPETGVARDVTVGWLLDSIAAGRVPRGKPPSFIATRADYLAFTFEQNRFHGVRTGCHQVSQPEPFRLGKGQSLIFSDGDVDLIVSNGGKAGLFQTSAFTFRPADGERITAWRNAVSGRLRPSYIGVPTTVCRAG